MTCHDFSSIGYLYLSSCSRHKGAKVRRRSSDSCASDLRLELVHLQFQVNKVALICWSLACERTANTDGRLTSHPKALARASLDGRLNQPHRHAPTPAPTPGSFRPTSNPLYKSPASTQNAGFGCGWGYRMTAAGVFFSAGEMKVALMGFPGLARCVPYWRAPRLEGSEIARMQGFAIEVSAIRRVRNWKVTRLEARPNDETSGL